MMRLKWRVEMHKRKGATCRVSVSSIKYANTEDRLAEFARLRDIIRCFGNADHSTVIHRNLVLG
jgi:hypothetical protein